MRTWKLALSFAAVLVATSPALAAPPSDAQRCESSFEQSAARFAECRLTAESRFTRTNDGAKRTATLVKCSTRLADALAGAVTKYGGKNCTTEAPSAFDAYLTQCSDDVEAAAAIGGAIPTVRQSFPATGQTACWDTDGTEIPCAGTGQDGEVQAGRTQAYVDNGDGTITDTNTRLMWEKLDDNDVGGIHDKDATYTWADALGTRIRALNAGGGFAGHTDWRLPNLAELESIRNLQAVNPAVAPAFHSGCVPGCTVLTCSCTGLQVVYWSSSTYADLPSTAWTVAFGVGNASTATKVVLRASARAVRGGS